MRKKNLMILTVKAYQAVMKENRFQGFISESVSGAVRIGEKIVKIKNAENEPIQTTKKYKNSSDLKYIKSECKDKLNNKLEQYTIKGYSTLGDCFYLISDSNRCEPTE